MSIKELRMYWQIIKKRLWLIGLLVVATLGGIVLFSYLAEPVYKATASFQVTTPLPAGVSLFSEFRTSSSRDELFYTRSNFITVLQSQYVVGRALEELGIDVDVGELVARMEIESDEGDFIMLHVTAEAPHQAAALVNTIMAIASQYFGELNAGSVTASKEFIQQQLAKVKNDLDQANAALLQFQIENRVGSQEGLLSAQEFLIRTLKANQDSALTGQGSAAAAAYDQIISKRERELQDLILLDAQYSVLRENVARIGNIYSDLLDKETEAKLKENEILSAGFVQVIPAREPSHPLPRFSVKILLLGAVLSLSLGIMLAFLLEYWGYEDAETGKDGVPAMPEVVANPTPNERIDVLKHRVQS